MYDCVSLELFLFSTQYVTVNIEYISGGGSHVYIIVMHRSEVARTEVKVLHILY